LEWSATKIEALKGKAEIIRKTIAPIKKHVALFGLTEMILCQKTEKIVIIRECSKNYPDCLKQ
jgi:hypothetical protein